MQKVYFFNFLSLPSDILRFSVIMKNLQVFKKPYSKNPCSNIFSGTESDVLVHLLVIHLRDLQSINFPSDIILYFVIDPGVQSKAKNILSGNRYDVKDTVKLMKIEFGEMRT